MPTDQQLIARNAARLLGLKQALSSRWSPLPHQIPPDGDWYGWLLLAGRMAGKTDACAHYVHNHVNGPPCLSGPVPHWIAIIGPTHGDAVTSCFKGPSGLRVHSPGAKLVQDQGGTVVRWPNGSEAKIFGAHSEEDVERLRSGGNRSIAVGTPVHTERGMVPIEQVKVGDRVWTRLGLRPVIGSWDHGLRPLWTIRTRSGRELRLTPDHKVWTQRGWVRCDQLSVNDTLSSWNTEVTAGSVWGRTGHDPSVMGTGTGRSCSIDRSTRTTTDQYPTAGTSTTRITTSRTTTRPTWRPGHPETTTGTMTRGRSGTLLAVEQPNGTRSLIAIASNVGSGSIPAGTDGSAPRSAGESTNFKQPPACSHALCAEEISRSGGSPLLSLAPDPVETISPGSTEGHVWDLTVAGEHEFLANDLLVSNCLSWLEELAAWRHLDAAWDHMRLGLRVGPRPHWIASTTPKPKPLIKKLNSGEIARVELTRASYRDNPYIPPEIKEALEDSYGGTQLGRQELYGEVIDQDENALWTHEIIDQFRVRPGDVPSLARISVGVDPSGGQGEQGIIVAGKSKPFALPGQTRLQAHGYVLDDRTCHLPPAGWGKRAVQAAIDWEADEIFAEVNYGGEMCVSTLRAACEDLGVNIPIRIVRATRGKAIRAQPVSALTVQGRWHHAGNFPELENQMTTWYPELDWSPDRLDGSVWNAWGLKLVHTAPAGKGSLGQGMTNRVLTA